MGFYCILYVCAGLHGAFRLLADGFFSEGHIDECLVSLVITRSRAVCQWSLGEEGVPFSFYAKASRLDPS